MNSLIVRYSLVLLELLFSLYLLIFRSSICFHKLCDLNFNRCSRTKIQLVNFAYKPDINNQPAKHAQVSLIDLLENLMLNGLHDYIS